MKIIKQSLNFSSDNLITLIKHIQDNGGQARIVGGAVRDYLLSYFLNKPIIIKDIDIATDLLPEELISLFNKNNIKTIPSGIKHGTISVFIGEEIFEITTLRQDISTDGRHAEVKFSKDFAADAARRDFTINALSYDIDTGQIYDYYNGYEDLKNSTVKFVGKAFDRINEDYLRILRFFRFSARFTPNIDQEALDACILLKDKLSKLSKERIKDELDKIINLGSAGLKILELMFEKTIIQEILPIKYYNITQINNAMNFTKILKDDIQLESFYAILLARSDVTIHNLLEIKFSNKSSKITMNLIDFTKNTNICDDFQLTKIWLQQDNFTQYFILLASKVQDYQPLLKLYNNLSKRPKPKFPINGHDLLAIGIEGREISKQLLLLKDIWIKSDFSITKQDLLQNIFKKD